jgi:hypothetical protein
MDRLVHHELVPLGQSVAGHSPVQVLKRLRDTVVRKRHHKWRGQRFLRHNDAPSHTSLVVQQFRSETNILVITQTALPDFAAREFRRARPRGRILP